MKYINTKHNISTANLVAEIQYELYYQRVKQSTFSITRLACTLPKRTTETYNDSNSDKPRGNHSVILYVNC